MKACAQARRARILTGPAARFQFCGDSILIDNSPAEKRQEIVASNSLMNGPQIKPGNADAVTDQSQVDDLLASLGF